MTFAEPVVSVVVERGPVEDRRVLLQVRSKESAGRFRGLLELPQGKLMSGESVIDCARRELYDEAGLTEFRPRRTFRHDEVGEEALESLETLVVRERGTHDFIAICVVGSAAGDPRPSAEADDPGWYSQHDVAARIQAGQVFPLNVPMLTWYWSLSLGSGGAG